MKYIIFQEKDIEANVPYVTVFDDVFVHRDVARGFGRQSEGRGFYVVAAGFFFRNDTTGEILVIDQKSESLKVGPRPEDGIILKLALDHGLSGLNLMNYMTMMELNAIKELKRGNHRKHQ